VNGSDRGLSHALGTPAAALKLQGKQQQQQQQCQEQQQELRLAGGASRTDAAAAQDVTA
jgi:hypothetical protein